MKRSKTVLDREILLQSLLGYAEVNRITEAERCDRLRQRTNDEALALFAALYKTWKISGKGKIDHVIAQQREKEFIALRRLFDQFARKRGDR